MFILVLFLAGLCCYTPVGSTREDHRNGQSAYDGISSTDPPSAVRQARESGVDVVNASANDKFVMGRKLIGLRRAGPWPSKGIPFVDPVYHTTIVRVTDKEEDGYPDAGIKQEYARSDPENLDGTLLVLRGVDANWYLYDARSYKMLRTLHVLGQGDQEAEPRWDSANPDLLYHLRGMKLMTLNVRSGEERVVHDFKNAFPALRYVVTGSEGAPSADRRYWCFMIKDDQWQPRVVVMYDRALDAIIGRKPVTREIDALSADMTGRHCVIGWDSGPATAHPRDLSRTVILPEGVTGHQDPALTKDGRDVLVYQNTATDWIAMADLETGHETNLVPIPFTTNTDIGLHFSGNCTDKVPGWVLVSTYGALHPPAGRRQSWMDRQLFMVELKPNPRIWRIAEVHSITQSRAEQGEPSYFAEPFAAINRTGTRVYWGANWEGEDLHKIETFVARLPGDWARRLPE
jgi:hypothetical protein